PQPKPKPKPTGKLAVDGKLGPKTARGIQDDFGSTKHGRLGHSSWKAGQRPLKNPADGVISNQSITASYVGSAITQGWDYDGRNAAGSTFVKALQRLIGASDDGIWGRGTTRSLQTFLNKEGCS